MTASVDRRRAAQAQLIRRLSELAPKHRLDAMLEEVDGKALVRSLPAEDVYAAIVDAGLADATEIVQLSTPNQFRTFIDLAAWSRDRVDTLEVLRWIRAARGDDGEALSAKLQAIDLEVLELLYKQHVEVHDLEANPDVNPDGLTMETPEGQFLLELKLDGPDEAALRQLTQDLMAQNPFELARFLEAVRWEMPSELEETAFQFRQARLQDLGFPPLDEAAKVFAWVDPSKVGPAVPVAADAALTVASERADFVEAAFRGLGEHEREVLEAEVRTLVNSVLVAEGAEPGDPRALRRLSEAARDTLNLGLEHLCAGDPAKASDVVRDHTLLKAFQVGFSLTLSLRRQVERMSKDPGLKLFDAWLTLDDEVRALQALLKRRPLKALKVAGAEPVPFRSRKEIAESFALLDRVKAQAQVVRALFGDSPADVLRPFDAPLAKLTPQRVWLAAVLQAELGAGLVAKPLDEARLPEVLAVVLDGEGRVAKGAGAKAVAMLPEAQRTVGREMADRALGALADEFGPRWVKSQSVDPKTVATVAIAGQTVL